MQLRANRYQRSEQIHTLLEKLLNMISPEIMENVCRIVLLGNSKVGKTSIVSRFLHGHYPARHRVTYQELFKERVAIKLALEIEDIGALYAKENPEVVKESIKVSDIAVVVIALDDVNCLEQAAAHRETVINIKKEESIIIFAGNKSDLCKKCENYETMKNTFIEEWGCDYVECSAKKNTNITTIFKTVLEYFFSDKSMSRLKKCKPHIQRNHTKVQTQSSFELFGYLKTKTRKRITSNISSNSSLSASSPVPDIASDSISNEDAEKLKEDKKLTLFSFDRRRSRSQTLRGASSGDCDDRMSMSSRNSRRRISVAVVARDIVAKCLPLLQSN